MHLTQLLLLLNIDVIMALFTHHIIPLVITVLGLLIGVGGVAGASYKMLSNKY